MEITSVGLGVIALVGGAAVRWANEQFRAIKSTQKVLFEKKDDLDRALNEFKLDVAQNYVNREAMKEALNTALAPIVERLKELHEDFRDLKKRGE